ncbi:M28 family metallopeptidase [Chitinimonas sp.]|uniref:M28 family metallopeptidase n=1 Tax=Chitinimonas sp. TaxID=1934313 RepID=UPI0035B3429A
MAVTFSRHLLIALAALTLPFSHADTAPAAAVEAARTSIDAARMSALVKKLSGPEYGGRLAGSAGDDRARDDLLAEFRAIGLQPAGSEGYLQPFKTTITQPDGHSHGNPPNPLLGKAASSSNIIGILPGNDPLLKQQLIIISAHRDHLGHRPDGQPYPGANDDLSGVAATLELARAFKQLDKANRRTLMFVAYGAEEQEMMGSIAHVKALVREGRIKDVVLMLSIDMIGSDFDEFQKPAFGKNMVDRWLRQAYSNKRNHYDDYSHQYDYEPGPEYDYDAGPFSHCGVNNRVIGRADVDHYHKITDTWENVDFDTAARVTGSVFDLVWRVDQKTEKPTQWKRPEDCR